MYIIAYKHSPVNGDFGHFAMEPSEASQDHWTFTPFLSAAKKFATEEEALYILNKRWPYAGDKDLVVKEIIR